MTLQKECKDEGCGLDGKSEHLWRYFGGDENAGRKCAFCNKKQSMMGLWEDWNEDWT